MQQESTVPEHADRPAENMDSLLLPFLAAASETEELLARLVSEIADPIIRNTLCQKLHVSLRPSDGSVQNQDALDLAQSVRALVISELRHLKANQGERHRNLLSFPTRRSSDHAVADFESPCIRTDR